MASDQRSFSFSKAADDRVAALEKEKLLWSEAIEEAYHNAKEKLDKLGAEKHKRSAEEAPEEKVDDATRFKNIADRLKKIEDFLEVEAKKKADANAEWEKQVKEDAAEKLARNKGFLTKEQEDELLARIN